MGATAQTPKAVLKMPSKWGDKVVRAQTIQGKMTGNTYFPTGWIANGLTQAQFNADVLAFTTQEAAVEAHTPGVVGLRNAAYTTLKEDLEYVKVMVQAKANANSTIAVHCEG